MKCVLCFLLLVCLKCTNIYAATTEKCKSSSVGTNFIFGIIGTAFLTETALFIIPTMQVPAHVRVTAPFIKMDRTYTVSNNTIVPLNGTLMDYETGTQFKGIEVTSDVDISLLIITTEGRDYFDACLGLPVTVLGSRYIAASYYPYSQHSSEILVAGLQNDTDVILNTVKDGHVRSNHTFRLQKFETYQFKSNNDVSGSIITSNKPVAVFSGSAMTKIPDGIGNLQHLTEQMIPTKFWTKKFIIPPGYPRRHFVLKFVADQDNTTVQCYNGTNHFAVSMHEGSVKELLFGTDPVIVIADKPISVVQYGQDNMAGDPFMSKAQGISQFQNIYEFAQNNYNTSGSDTLAITILKNNSSGLVLNGHPMAYWSVQNIPVAPPMDEFITLLVNISFTTYFTYHLHHSGGIKFGAVFYGRPGNAVALGYPLQLSITDIDCVNHETSFMTTPPDVKTTSVSTNPNQTVPQGKGTWCFQCDGMTHLQYCDQVQRCQTHDEICYVQKYPRSLDVNLFRSGCIRPERCSSDDGTNGCMECCHGDFCNKAGCGDKGFPALGQRGPICFDCTHKGEDEDCTTVQLCHSNQACMVAKYEWGDNNFHYIMGCTDSQVCSTKRSLAELSKRHVPVCTHCCHSDFCNMNCTSIDSSPSIIG